MSRLLRLAQNNINATQNNINEEQMIDIVNYINKEATKIIRDFKSFLDLMAKINRLIINVNDTYNLNPAIKKFTMQEFAKATFFGFDVIYQRISYQDLNNIAKNIEKLKDINISNDFNKLDINEREEICKIIFNNIDTTQIKEEMFDHIGSLISDKVSVAISNRDYFSYYMDIMYSFINSNYRVKQDKPLHHSFLMAWIRTNQNNIIQKINNIIHNTVPITYDNYASYDDDQNLNEKGTNPNTWVTYTDKQDPIHGIRESDIAPMYFSSIRLSPLVVLDNEVLFSDDKEMHHNDLINKYKQEHQINESTEGLAYTGGVKSILEEFGAQNMAIGSLFQGKIALLEYITDGNFATNYKIIYWYN